jgi:transglutaminase-like putative cysteine protease
MIKYEKNDLFRIIISLLLAVAVPVFLYIYLKAEGSVFLLVLYCLFVNVLFYSYYRTENKYKLILFWCLIILQGLMGSFLLLKTVLYPYSAFEEWISLFNNKGIGGKFPLLFVIYGGFISSFFAGLLYSKKYLKPVLGFVFFIMFLLTVIHQNIIFAAIFISISVIILIVIIASNVKTKRYIKKTVFAVLVFIFVFLLSIGLSMVTTPGGVGSLQAQPEVIDFMVNLFPDLPVILGVPGVGVEFDSKSFYSRPVFTPNVIMNVQGRAGEIIYLRVKILDQFDGSKWKISQEQLLENEGRYDFIITEYEGEGIPLKIRIEAELFKYIPHTISTETVTVQSKDDLNIRYASKDIGIILEESFLPDTSLTLWRQTEKQDNIEKLSEEELQRYLFVNINATERTRELATQFEGENNLAVINNIKKYLFDNYVYNLDINFPKESDMLDYFLFEAKEGYCVHYSTAFAVLARLNNIPVRYINGYLVLIPFDSYTNISVTGYNSHAWVEVWLPDRGWMQVEVTPPMLPEALSNPYFYDYFNLDQYSFAEQQLEAIFGDSIVKTSEKEKEEDFSYIYIVTSAVAVLITALAAVYIFLKKKVKKYKKAVSRNMKKYQSRLRKIVLKLSKKGFEHPENTGWLIWKNNLIQTLPEHKEIIENIVLTAQKAFYSKYIPQIEDIETVDEIYRELVIMSWI